MRCNQAQRPLGDLVVVGDANVLGSGIGIDRFDPAGAHLRDTISDEIDVLLDCRHHVGQHGRVAGQSRRSR